jgi:hypothetical protein
MMWVKMMMITHKILSPVLRSFVAATINIQIQKMDPAMNSNIDKPKNT